MPLSAPRHRGQMPTYYHYKGVTYLAAHVDEDVGPAYPFGYGLSYTSLETSGFGARSMPSNSTSTFGAESPVTFTVMVTNNGSVTESYVPQVYPLQRVSHISQPVKQLVAFMRVYLDLGESRVFSMKPEVERYLKILNRRYEWEVEKGEYTITLLANGGIVTDTGVNVTMRCGLGELASTR